MTKFKARRPPLLRQAVAVFIAGLAIGVAPVAKANLIFDSSVPGLYTITLPTTGVYDITAFGARGGSWGADGGLGAEIGGSVALSAGQALTVVVGQMGGFPGGGGGGTYVVLGEISCFPGCLGSVQPLVVAGGGGGSGASGAGGDGSSLNYGSTGGVGGSGGALTVGGGGGGGGGFSGDGSDGSFPGAGGGGGISFVHGFVGGPGGSTFCFGGPGGIGGGGGAGCSGVLSGSGGGGGGGGGYSGGGGGDGYGGGGGGGGSYLAPYVTETVSGLSPYSDGFVDIVRAPAPTPGGGLAGLSALALAGLCQRRRRS